MPLFYILYTFVDILPTEFNKSYISVFLSVLTLHRASVMKFDLDRLKHET